MGSISRISLLAALALCLPVSLGQAAPLSLTTEELPPRNFTKDGKIVGIGSEQVFELMKRAGIDYKVESMPWTRAISLAESEDNTCAFSTLHTDTRHAKFKWVEPLDQENIILVRKKGGAASPANLDAAKEMTVGVQSKSAPYDVAVKHGFTKLEQVPNYELIVNKILADRTELGIVSKSSAMSYLTKGDIEEVMVVEPKAVGLACSKSVPDDTIAKLNAALDTLIKDGTQAKIKASYDVKP